MQNDQNWLAYLTGRQKKFSPYSVGDRRYGLEGRSAPNIGPTSKPEAYQARDAEAEVTRNAMLRRMQAKQKGKYMSSSWLRKL